MTARPPEGPAPSRWERDWLILEVTAACAVPSDDNLDDLLEPCSSLKERMEELGRWARREENRCDAHRRLVLATLDLIHTRDAEERLRRFNRICYRLLRIDPPDRSRIADPDCGFSGAEAETFLQESLEQLDSWKATVRAKVPWAFRDA